MRSCLIIILIIMIAFMFSGMVKTNKNNTNKVKQYTAVTFRVVGNGLVNLADRMQGIKHDR